MEQRHLETWKVGTVSSATEAVDVLLGELALAAYVFVVEPKRQSWEVKIEYAALDGWRTATLTVDGKDLLSSRHDNAARRRLLEEWGHALASARRLP